MHRLDGALVNETIWFRINAWVNRPNLPVSQKGRVWSRTTGSRQYPENNVSGPARMAHPALLSSSANCALPDCAAKRRQLQASEPGQVAEDDIPFELQPTINLTPTDRSGVEPFFSESAGYRIPHHGAVSSAPLTSKPAYSLNFL
jgi:hypothetical protein